MTTDTRHGYYRRIAQNVGVEPMWIDDAIQQAAIAVWRAGDAAPWKTVAQREIIDFARVYGRRDRRGNSRATVHLTRKVSVVGDLGAAAVIEDGDRPELTYDPWAAVNDVIDMRDALARLLPQHRDAIARSAWHDYRHGDRPFAEQQKARAMCGRRSLRAVLAGRRPFRAIYQMAEAA